MNVVTATLAPIVVASKIRDVLQAHSPVLVCVLHVPVWPEMLAPLYGKVW